MPRYTLILFLMTSAVCWSACAGERIPHVRSAAPVSRGVIEINTASAEQLESLPGIGSGTAEKIVAFRGKHGPFRRIEQLLLIDGISEKKYRSIRLLVRVSPPN